MRSLLVVGVLLAAVSVLVPSDLAAGRVATQGPRVTIFGDSVADSLEYVPEAQDVLGKGVDLQLQLSPCRKLVSPGCAYMGARPRSVLDIVQDSSVALGNIVIVDVGYNEPANNYEADMSRVAIALAGDGVGHVLWVTMREQTDDYRTINQIIRAQAPRWPQIQVVDWEAASRGKDWFNDDGLHLNAAGALGLATLLRPYVLAACGSECAVVSPAAPRNVRVPVLRGVSAVGRTLTCRPGQWQGARPLVFSYRWLRNEKVLAGVKGPTRKLVAADLGRRIACRVWAANAAGAAQASSNPRLVRAP
jgi:hypothetical protein